MESFLATSPFSVSYLVDLAKKLKLLSSTILIDQFRQAVACLWFMWAGFPRGRQDLCTCSPPVELAKDATIAVQLFRKCHLLTRQPLLIELALNGSYNLHLQLLNFRQRKLLFLFMSRRVISSHFMSQIEHSRLSSFF